ncbi:hypothetical protein BCIN_10g02320 [Botrytis cinerea B05.10]|uniref:C2H2-type domain-containing protein n=1 Tax=Botryotinia fuckeliana (strain B05.10) TaxID=332648 RepID=A0A384JUE5_BOTFB|nr:hypothetical protein BCIN_10g02320 [Botrytis cinerea B05.10]ATZ54216.1 hypothetical protein BCIN_10g02320 [Botrytis cinerea B05.10]
MATNTRKRTGDASLELSTKRLRIDASSSLPAADIIDGDNDNEYKPEQDQISEEEEDTMEAADTPNTPFSPVPGKKFPSEYKTIKCTYEGCTKTFNRPARLAAHLRSHANERPFICSYEGCDKAYIEEKHLKQHIKGSHTHEREYTCDWEGCSKSFLTATRLRRHKDAHEGHERFRCTSYPPCNQTFRKHQTLQRHIRSDHLDLAPFPCTYIDPVTNELCKAGFDASGGLKKHMERTHGAATFLCEECTVPGKFHEDGTPVPLAFTTNAKLQAHIKKEHANCMFCDRKCSSQQLLQKHIDTQHSGTTLEERKNIPCEYPGCPKTFTKRANLQVHMRTVHDGQRFICGTFDVSQNPDLASWNGSDSCGKDFVSKVNLEDHVRTHHLGLSSILNARGKRKTDSQARRSTRRAPEQTEIEELAGYDPRRTIDCVVQGCPHKFMRDYDFHEHMRIHHQDVGFMDGQNDMNLNIDMGMVDHFPYTDTGGELPSLDFMTDGTGMDMNALDMGMDLIDPALHTPNFNLEASTSASGSAAASIAPSLNGWDTADVAAEIDLDWDFQRQVLEGGRFWIGGDEQQIPEGSHDWSRDQAEMRSLID